MKYGRMIGLMAAVALSSVSFAAAAVGITSNKGSFENLGPAPRKKEKRGRKSHAIVHKSRDRYPYSSDRQDARHKGWPTGPMNNREPITHQPRMIIGDLGTTVGFARIGGTTGNNWWGSGRRMKQRGGYLLQSSRR